jgi:hypothetical protein
MIDLKMPVVAEYFEEVGDGRWRCKQTQMIIHGQILEFYKSVGNGLNGLTLLGLPLTMEVYPFFDNYIPPDIAAIQKFERAIVAHDPAHLLDTPPGSGSVYLMHRNTSVKRMMKKESLRYVGITSSYKHIALFSYLDIGVHMSVEEVERAIKDNLNPNDDEKFDPDWWEARIDKSEKIYYFDAIREYKRFQ